MALIFTTGGEIITAESKELVEGRYYQAIKTNDPVIAITRKIQDYYTRTCIIVVAHIVAISDDWRR